MPRHYPKPKKKVTTLPTQNHGYFGGETNRPDHQKTIGYYNYGETMASPTQNHVLMMMVFRWSFLHGATMVIRWFHGWFQDGETVVPNF